MYSVITAPPMEMEVLYPVLDLTNDRYDSTPYIQSVMTRGAHLGTVTGFRVASDCHELYLWHKGEVIGLQTWYETTDIHYGDVWVPAIMYLHSQHRNPAAIRAFAAMRRDFLEAAGAKRYIRSRMTDDGTLINEMRYNKWDSSQNQSKN